MKLNLNFDLYKGTTRLKQWYKEVKAHFTQVQEAHNALEDTVAAESGKLSTEITQRTNADIALNDRINAEENIRSSADASLGQRITTEAKNREKADNNLQVRIDEISQSSGTSALFGENTIQHTVQFVNPMTIPTLDWVNSECAIRGEGMKIDTAALSLETSFFIDGEQVAVTSVNDNIHAVENSIYIIIKYNIKTGSVELYSSGNAVESVMDGDVWTFTPFHYYDIVTEWDEGTGYYWIDGYQTEHTTANEDESGSMYKVSANYERLRTLDNLNTENKNSFLDAVNENTDKINYIISIRPSGREIFVMCDGDHDELKIQAALDAVATGGVVYPVTSSGGAVVLTNANTNKGYSPITAYDVVLKVGSNKTLDFRFCDGVMFDNANPGNNQAIFQLSQYAEIKNLWTFSESSNTCTAESINPTVLYTEDYCMVDNCSFDSIQGMNTTTASQYLFRVGQYCKFRNNKLNGISLNDITKSQRGFDFGTGTVVENNLFQNITSSWTAAKVFYFLKCNVEKNTFNTFDLGGNTFYIDSSFTNNNRFSATNNTSFRFGGIVNGNRFQTITASEHGETFLADNSSNVVDNLFYAITANDSYALVTVNNNATFSNKMSSITPPTNSTAIIDLYEGAILKENTIKIKDTGSNSDVVIVADQEGYSLIKDNITNAASMGYIDSSSVVEGNITGFGA